MNVLRSFILTAVIIGCCFFYSGAQSYAKLDDKTWALYDKGDLTGALENAQKALKQAQKEFGQKHSKTAEAMFTVALFLEFNNYSKEAEKYYLDALEMTRQTDGEKSESYVYGLEMVGGYYSMNGNLIKAIEYYRQNLKACENYFGTKGEEYAISLNNLGVNLDLAGYYTEAVALLEQAAMLIKSLAGENDVKTANMYKDLAHAYSNAVPMKNLSITINQPWLSGKRPGKRMMQAMPIYSISWE
jgi:tetratricopeptide (TPR) repeat protein